MFIPCRRFEGDLIHSLSVLLAYTIFIVFFFDAHYISLHLPAEILYLYVFFWLVCYSWTLCHFFPLRMKSYIKSIMRIDKWLFAQSRECQHCPCGMHIHAYSHTHTHQIIIIRVQGSIFVVKRVEWVNEIEKGHPKTWHFERVHNTWNFKNTHTHTRH